MPTPKKVILTPDEVDYLSELSHSLAWPDGWHELNYTQEFKENVYHKLVEMLSLCLDPPIPFYVGTFECTYIPEEDSPR